MATRINTAAINRVLLGFFVAFIAISALAGVYEVFWVLPEKHCLSEGHWWDPDKRICAKPIDLQMFTGRPNKTPQTGGPVRSPS